MLFSNKVVMIIDDSYTIRHQVKLLLSKYDIIVIEAYDKKSMLNHLHYKGRLVDLILMDLGLKEMTGFDLMEFLQNTNNYKDIPIIVLTGDATKNTVLETISTFTLEHYAIKPIDPSDLSTKVLNVLEKNHFSDRTPPSLNNKVAHEESSSSKIPKDLMEKSLDQEIEDTLNSGKFSIKGRHNNNKSAENESQKKNDPSKYHVHIENIEEE